MRLREGEDDEDPDLDEDADADEGEDPDAEDADADDDDEGEGEDDESDADDLEGLTPEQLVAKVKAERAAKAESVGAVERLKRENEELRQNGRGRPGAGDASPDNAGAARTAKLRAVVTGLSQSKDPRDLLLLEMANEILTTKVSVKDSRTEERIRASLGEDVDDDARDARLAEVRAVQKRHGAPDLGTALLLWKGEQFDKAQKSGKKVAKSTAAREETQRRHQGVRTGVRPMPRSKARELPAEMEFDDYTKIFDKSTLEQRKKLLARERSGALTVRPPKTRG